MDKNHENSYANDSQRSFNYNANDDLGQRQLNYDEEAGFPDLAAMLEREVAQANDLRQQVDTEAAQSLTLLESKDKSYLYETTQFYLLWEWKANNSSKQILALRKNPEQGAISLSNAKSQEWEDYFPNESSQAKIIVEASKNAPVRGQLSSELYGEIERLFSIDLSQVVFVRNSAKATQLKARAVTIGQEIHFAPNEWNEENESFITLLAHELAHIYQNKQNRVGATNMLGNQPINDDPRMEAEADQAAEATKKGRRFNFAKFKSGDNDLMKQFAQRKVAQRKALKTNWGEFEAIKYEKIEDTKAKTSKIDFKLIFKPYKNVDSPKIGFVQTVKTVEGDNKIAPDPTAKSKMAEDGTRIDRVSDNNNPVYGTNKLDANNLDIEYSTENGEKTTKFGKQTANEYQDAELSDTPTVVLNEGRETSFETTAVSLEGTQKNTYYGSVTWGWKIKDGEVIRDPLGVGSKESISDKFVPAIDKWNASSQASGNFVTNEKTIAYFMNGQGHIVDEKDVESNQQFVRVGSNVTFKADGVNVTIHCIVREIEDGNIKPQLYLIAADALNSVDESKVAQLKRANSINSTPDEAQLDITKEYTTKESLVDVSHTNSQENANVSITQGARVKISREPETKGFLITVVEDENNPNLKDETFILDLRGRNLSEIINLNN